MAEPAARPVGRLRRRSFLRLALGAGAAGIGASCEKGKTMKRPNVILLITDEKDQTRGRDIVEEGAPISCFPGMRGE